MELSGKMYLCSNGETFDGVALAVYGSEIYAADLLCANPEHGILARFKGGERLLLPVVVTRDSEEDDETAAVPDKAPWKE